MKKIHKFHCVQSAKSKFTKSIENMLSHKTSFWCFLLLNLTTSLWLMIGKVAPNWNFFKIIWFLHHLNALNERISEELMVYIWPSSSRDIWISVLQKRGFFKQDLKGTYWNGTKKKSLMFFFCSFLGINTCDPKFENKGFFHANFYGAWHERFFGSKAVTFRI